MIVVLVCMLLCWFLATMHIAVVMSTSGVAGIKPCRFLSVFYASVWLLSRFEVPTAFFGNSTAERYVVLGDSRFERFQGTSPNSISRRTMSDAVLKC